MWIGDDDNDDDQQDVERDDDKVNNNNESGMINNIVGDNNVIEKQNDKRKKKIKDKKKVNKKSSSLKDSINDLTKSSSIKGKDAQLSSIIKKNDSKNRENNANKRQKIDDNKDNITKAVDPISYSTDQSKLNFHDLPGRKPVEQLSSSLRGLKFMKRKEDEEISKKYVSDSRKENKELFWTLPQSEINLNTFETNNSISCGEMLTFIKADDSDEVPSYEVIGRKSFGNSINSNKNGNSSSNFKVNSQSTPNIENLENSESDDDDDNSENSNIIFKLANMRSKSNARNDRKSTKPKKSSTNEQKPLRHVSFPQRRKIKQ